MPRLCVFLALLVGAAAGSAEEIWEIQGGGLSSPFEGQTVTVADSTITAVGTDLFFIQTPDSQTDNDPWTSDGLLVMYPDASSLAVGDLVSLRGTVVEHYGQTELRQVSSVTVASTGHPRPAPVELDSEIPAATQPWPTTELERFEGMWVRVQDGVVTGPTDRYGDAWVTSAGRRLYREPGIEYPGLPGLPVWDGNPEAFEIDPDALGGDHFDLSSGDRFTARGALGYAFGSYQLWPAEFELVAAAALPMELHRAAAGDLTIGSQNCRRLEDGGGDVPTADRLAKLSLQIRRGLGAPSIVGVQEVENLEILEDLAARIGDDEPGLVYTAHLIEGNDFSGIDVGFLVREGVRVDGVRAVGSDVRFTWDQSLLFDRPPLVLETGYGALDLSVVVVHLRSLSGIEEAGASGERVRRKRFEQSEWLSGWIQEQQLDRPDDGLLVIGDFNAFEFSDGYVDVLGQITGRLDPAGALIPAEVEVEPELHNALTDLPAQERYSFIYQGSAEALDHALVDVTLRPLLRSLRFVRGNADAPESRAADPETMLRSSDHDGLVVTIGPPVRRSGGRRTP